MAFDDLDLEFEDEEEAKKKKNEAVQVDVDLEFAVPENREGKPRPALVKPPQASTAQAVNKTANPVTKLADARAAKPLPRPASDSVPSRTSAPAPRSAGSSALQENHHEFEGQQIVEMREQMRRIEFEADVKVAIAEYKTELLSELLSDTKLMQHQIEQLLVRINAKHPDMKQEVLMIKKILADFTIKKRK